MRNIEVFYHLYIPDTENAKMWVWWVDEQLSAIKQSNLHKHAKINIAITMPIFRDNLYSDVKSYLALKYPFAHILNVRDTAMENIYEGHTLSYLYDACLSKDIDVLYFHSKGSANFNMYSFNWKQILNHFCITKWKECVERLEHCDVVGVSDPSIKNGRFKIDGFASGNFWWSKSEHIRKLKHPMNISEYARGMSSRYTYEHWVLGNIGTVDYIFDLPIDLENAFYFLEDVKD